MNNLERARLSLEGLSVADALGGFFEFQRGDSMLAVARKTPSAPWRYTDDTNMALSIYEILRLHEEIKQDELAKSYGVHFERGRGYGMSMAFILPKLATDGDWRLLTKAVFQGGSFGNGGPMKIAPLGAYFADDLDKVVEQVKLATVVSHAHSEAVAGSIAVAVAAAIAWNAREGDPPHPADFIGQVLERTPKSEVREGIERGQHLTTETPFREVVTVLGNGARIASMDTVPFVIWCAANYLRDYEDAIWQSILAGGDVDTIAAMVGGIVACFAGMDAIPRAWRESREPLPAWALG